MVSYRVICAALLASTLVGSSAAADDMQAIAAGQALAERACAKCHNIGLSGESAASGAAPLRSLTSTWSHEEIEDAIKSGLSVSHRRQFEMKFSVVEVAAMMAFLHSLGQETEGG